MERRTMMMMLKTMIGALTVAVSINVLAAAGASGQPGPGPTSAGEAARGELQLTLEQCLVQALAANPRAARDAYLRDAADAGLDGSRGRLLPSVGLRGNYRHTLDHVRLVPAREPGEVGTFADDIAGLDAVLRQPLYSGGRINAGIDGARARVDSAAGNLARTRQELVYNVSTLFHAILGQRKVVESVAASRGAMEEHRRRVADLLSAEKAARVDLLRTEVRLADLEQRLVREANILAIYHRRLANLLGSGDGLPAFTIVGSLEETVVEVPDLAVSLAVARVARPDLAAMRAAVAVQEAGVAIARADGRPQIFLEGTYGGRWALSPENQQPGAASAEDAGFVGVAVAIPLFEGGRVRAAVHEARARLAAYGEELRGLELGVQLEVETARLNIQAAERRVQATTKAVEQAAESLRIEREKYEMGKGSMTDVLDAQAASLEAETTYAQALVGHAVAVAELRLATGEQE